MTDWTDFVVSKSMYESWAPEDLPAGLQEFYEISATGDHGFDSGRQRFFVKCKRCGEILHKNTTGPNSYIASHEGKYGDQYACKGMKRHG